MLLFSKKTGFFLIFCASFLQVQAQHRFSGQVLSAHLGLPVPFAHIQSGTAAATADSLGRFTLESEALYFTVSALGFAEHRQVLDGDERFFVLYLNPEAQWLQEVRIEARAPVHPLREPAAVQVLGARELDRDQGLILTDALNRVPGVFMQSGSLNTNRISIRGIGARSPFGTAKIRAYLDDIPLTNGVGETTLEDLDLSLVQSVEIWKGPSASFLGAGLGGVLVLHPFSEPGNLPRSFGEARYHIGAYGTRRQVWRAVLTEPETPLQFQLNYNQLESDGYRANNQLQRRSLNVLGQLAAGKHHRLSAILNYTDSRAEIPSSINRRDYEQDPRRAAANWAAVKGFEDYERLMSGISHQIDWWKGAGGKTLSSTLSLFSVVRSNYESRPFNILREQDRSMGARAKIEYRKGALRKTPNLVAGVEYFREVYDWTTNATQRGVLDTLLSDNKELRRYSNWFAEYSAALHQRWSLTLGTNLNLTEYVLSDYFPRDKVDLGGERRFDPVLSPRVSLRYQPHPQVSLFATAGHGFAAPTLEETLLPQGLINPDIRPEQGWNVEMGTKGNHLNGRLSHAWSVYALFVKDLLVARRTAEDAYIGLNAGKTRHQGMDLALQYALLQRPWRLDLGAAYAFAHYRFREFTDDQGGDYSGNRLTGAPPHQLSATLDLEAPFGPYLRLSYQFVDAFPMRDDNSAFSEPWGIAHVKAGYTLTLQAWALEACAGIQNATNTRYAAMIQVNAAAFGSQLPRYYYPGLPRNAYLEVRVKRSF